MTQRAQVLIVDDDPIAVQVLYATLRGASDVRFAANGAEALAVLSQYPIDLVLLDANMPVMDGFTTCTAIKKDYPDVPVIFITAATDFASEIRALETGAVDFITKPIKPLLVRARVGTHLKLKAQSDQLRALVTSDLLTGIANRRALDEQIALEWRRALRNQSPLSLLMIDIDYFKPYNDRYGHVQGDACLRQVAQAIDAAVRRAGDLTARYGGEEFAVLLPGITVEQAAIVANKISEAVRALAIPHARSRVADRVTVSIGVACAVPGCPPDQKSPEAVDSPAPGSDLEAVTALFNNADEALYAAKAAGRNCVRIHRGAESPEPAGRDQHGGAG